MYSDVIYLVFSLFYFYSVEELLFHFFIGQTASVKEQTTSK
jgi:hypothetical protein